MSDGETRRVEDSTELFMLIAAPKGSVPIWRCVHCSTIAIASDYLVRSCCANDFPCITEGCAGRSRHQHHACPTCKAAAERRRNEKAPVGEWDDEAIYIDDRYYHSIFDYLEDLDELPDAHDLALECRIPIPGEWPKFSLCDYVYENCDFDFDEYGPGLPSFVPELDKLLAERFEKEPVPWVEAGPCRPPTEQIAAIIDELRREREGA